MGERYTKQGGNLSIAINKMLIQDGYCKTNKECFELLPGYGGHGDKVRFSFYQIEDSNSEAFLSIISLVMKEGMSITEGVPISILGFRETHQEYLKSGVFLNSVKPFFVLEINK